MVSVTSRFLLPVLVGTKTQGTCAAKQTPPPQVEESEISECVNKSVILHGSQIASLMWLQGPEGRGNRNDEVVLDQRLLGLDSYDSSLETRRSNSCKQY